MEHFHARHSAFFRPTDIETKSVVIIGCGSVGSEIGRLLARSGVLVFTLVDPDTVSPSNLSRSAFLERDVGREKVDALREHLIAIRSDVEVTAIARRLQDIGDDELLQMVSAADLIVAATDDPYAQARLSRVSYAVVPAIFIGVYARGMGGEVLWTTPEETPCFTCVLNGLREANAPTRGELDYGLSTGQLAAEPALGIDILHVTVCAAKIALALLLRDTGSPVAAAVDPERSVLFVGNAKEWLFREHFETVWARAVRRDDCVCRLGSHASTAELFSRDELRELEEAARAPLETGVK